MSQSPYKRGTKAVILELWLASNPTCFKGWDLHVYGWEITMFESIGASPVMSAQGIV